MTVTANAQTKAYGSADPALTFVRAVSSTVTRRLCCRRLTRAAGSNVGTYAITQGTLSAGANYAINFIGANLTITQALLTVTANPRTKAYGSADPALTYTSAASSTATPLRSAAA